MKIPVSEARRQLAGLLKTIQKDPRATIQITVRDEIVAELRAPQPGTKPGEAAKKLLNLRKKFARRGITAQRPDISVRVKDHLYGQGGAIE